GAARGAMRDPAPGRLGGAAAIDVGGVTEVDADLERGVGARPGLLESHPAREGQPRAERDLRDLQGRGAELAISHDAPCRRRAAGWRAGLLELSAGLTVVPGSVIAGLGPRNAGAGRGRAGSGPAAGRRGR